MTFAFLALASLAQDEPIDLQVEQQGSPPAPVVTGDQNPDFRARHNPAAGAPAYRYQIQVSTNPVIGTGPNAPTHWSSPAAGNPSRIPTPPPLPLAQGSMSREIAYGNRSRARTQTAPLLDWGGLYYWRIRFSADSNGALNAAPWSVTSSFLMALPPAGSSSADTNGHPSAYSWRSVALPIAAGWSVPASELLDNAPGLLRLDEPTRTWIPVGPGDLIQGGRGYIFPANPGVMIDLSQGKVASGRQVIPLTYTSTADNTFRGNHLLGNPFALPFRWRRPNAGGQVRTVVRTSLVCYQWDGTQYLTTHAGNGSGTGTPIIAPYRAVGVIATDVGAFLGIDEPPPVAGGSTQGVGGSGGKSTILAVPPGFDSNTWAVHLRADSAGVSDPETFVGTAPEALDDHDDHDGPELNGGDPSMPLAPWVLVTADHADWGENAGSYTHDVRGARYDPGDQLSWTLNITGNTNAPVTLTWPNLADLPTGDWAFSLEDPSTGNVIDLATASSFVTGPVDSATNGPIQLILRADRITEFIPSLLMSAAASGIPPAATVSEGDSDVALLHLDLAGVGEPLSLDTLAVTHSGTGNAAAVTVTLLRDDVVVAGPAAFTGGQVVWTGLAVTVDHGLPELWTLACDFGPGSRGTHRLSVDTTSTSSVGVYSMKPATVASAVIQGNVMTVTAPPGGCGLLGFEVFLAVIGSAFLRRGLR